MHDIQIQEYNAKNKIFQNKSVHTDSILVLQITK